MTDPSPLALPAEVESVLAERDRLRQQHARIAGEADRLRAIPDPTPEPPAVPLDRLTAERTPPAELLAALARLDEALVEIRETESSLAARQAELQQLKGRALTLLALGGAVLIVLLLALVMSLR
jgi:hypothetical protein